MGAQQLPMNLNPNAEKDNQAFMEMVGKNHRLEMKHGYAFRRVFGVSLHKYLSIATGFDVVAFDDEIIKAEDGVSTADAIKRDYGDDALNMVRELIS